MTKFLLDTGAVDSIADSVKDISNNARDVMRSVSKYDVSNEDNFNFESAKDAISTNVQSAYIKFRLTNQYLKKVVTTHTELQECKWRWYNNRRWWRRLFWRWLFWWLLWWIIWWR